MPPLFHYSSPIELGYNPADPFGILRAQVMMLDMAATCCMVGYMVAAGSIYAMFGRR